jgi:hypothetical protein
MSSHTYNLRKCIETEGKFCDIKKNYKAPRCPSNPAPNAVIPSSSERTQSLLNGTLKEDNSYVKTFTENIDFKNNNIELDNTFDTDKTYKISYIVNSKEDTDQLTIPDKIILRLKYGDGVADNEILKGTSNKLISHEFTLLTGGNNVRLGEVSLVTDTGVTFEDLIIPTNVTVTNIVISYDEVQSCKDNCNDESGNLKKNALLYNGSYAQYLKNNYNA